MESIRTAVPPVLLVKTSDCWQLHQANSLRVRPVALHQRSYSHCEVLQLFSPSSAFTDFGQLSPVPYCKAEARYCISGDPAAYALWIGICLEAGRVLRSMVGFHSCKDIHPSSRGLATPDCGLADKYYRCALMRTKIGPYYHSL